MPFFEANQVGYQQPFMQRNLATLIKRANGRGEWLAANVALIEAWTVALALQKGCSVHHITMRTYRAVRPKPCLDSLAGFVFVLEDRVG
jgi:hypothetical protein